MTTEGGPRPIPLRALPLALAALAVPVAGAVWAPDVLGDEAGLLLWLTPILPAFLLAYYRGWRGAALALAFAMASLAVANAVLLATGIRPPGWGSMMVLVVVYLILTQGVAALAELLERERRAAESMALTDPLTGLANRRQAHLVLARACEAARRGEELAVVLFDLDRFKAVNDRHGHAVGDMVLREMGERLTALTRRSDLAARFGGEEFLAVLRDTDARAAAAYAERVRREIRRAGLPCGRVTVSAGVAEWTREMASPDLLLAAADGALYRAKESGRDRVVMWTPPAKVEREAPAPVPSPRPIRVLVVDDDRAVEQSVARFLVRSGFEARAAGGALGALRHFERDGASVDLLLTDVVMPDMAGPTLVERLGRAGWAPRVVYMSGYLQGEVSARLLPGGSGHFVEKPLNLDALARLLRDVAVAEPLELKR